MTYNEYWQVIDAGITEDHQEAVREQRSWRGRENPDEAADTALEKHASGTQT